MTSKTLPSISVREIDDERARELHRLSFSRDVWPGSGCEFFEARINGELAGMLYLLEVGRDCYSIERIAVTAKFRRRGVCQHLIRYAQHQAQEAGRPRVRTYTALFNYPIMIALLRCGFRLTRPHGCGQYVGADWYYFEWRADRAHR